EDPDVMMIGIVSRLTDQKGFDLIDRVMDEICSDAVQIVVLGTGEARYEDMFRHYANKYPGKVSANIYYSEPLSHKIYASCDAFLMPSLFEPCGLSQLMSLRYGTVPIVRETGGLKDTVANYNEDDNTGTDFSFTTYNAHHMLDTIRYAEKIFYDRKDAWLDLVERGMRSDFSWNASARKYEELYEELYKEIVAEQKAFEKARKAAEKKAQKEAEKAAKAAEKAAAKEAEKAAKAAAKEAEKAAKAAEKTAAKKTTAKKAAKAEDVAVEEKPKAKRTTKKAAKTEEPVADVVAEEKPKAKRTTKKAAKTEE
ncbi:MAG: glycosyltransferase, partial [Clostridia bacterium]|nr:glycosyltransferase [Clostridia bacterium]